MANPLKPSNAGICPFEYCILKEKLDKIYKGLIEAKKYYT